MKKARIVSKHCLVYTACQKHDSARKYLFPSSPTISPKISFARDESNNTHAPTLYTQQPTPATSSTKIRLSILATALIDALGGPAEFHERFTFPLVTSMIPNSNFHLPPGVWTDDTSMTLCLARSLATFVPPDRNKGKTQSGHSGGGGTDPSRPRGGFSEKHQLDAYARWFEKGVLSATGTCFDIGNTIRRALSIYNRYTLNLARRRSSPSSDSYKFKGSINEVLEEIQAELAGVYCAGNGSLMRILPVGLAYWRNEEQARGYARRSSKTTHPNVVCLEACEVWTGAIVRIMQASCGGEGSGGRYTKLDLVEYFAEFAYTTQLREALTFPHEAPARPEVEKEREVYYRRYHPVLLLIDQAHAEVRPKHGFRWSIPSEEKLGSSGYVAHTLVAGLYCFLATETFENGAIMAVNLGNDADTVGAVYAGLAGCWYAGEDKEGDSHSVFWSERVREWREKLVKRELVEEVADELVEFSRTQV